jgi:hypothetical protein
MTLSVSKRSVIRYFNYSSFRAVFIIYYYIIIIYYYLFQFKVNKKLCMFVYTRNYLNFRLREGEASNHVYCMRQIPKTPHSYCTIWNIFMISGRPITVTPPQRRSTCSYGNSIVVNVGNFYLALTSSLRWRNVCMYGPPLWSSGQSSFT